jgi:hypothetical protein
LAKGVFVKIKVLLSELGIYRITSGSISSEDTSSPFPLLENEQSYIDKDSDQPTPESAFVFESWNVTGGC